MSTARRMPEGSRIVRFATFEIDLASGELRKQGVKIRLPEQAFQVLALLIEHSGEIVRREELRDRLWPGVSFVDQRKLVSPEAYEAYLRGRFFWNKGTDKDALSAIECFEKALEYDPDYALAYSGMADCYFRLGLYFALPSTDAGAKTKGAAARALKLNQHLGEAHTSMATALCWYDWHWAGAEREFRLALELKPNYAAAHNWYAAYLNAMLRFDEAAAEQRIAEELDPLSLMIAMTAADPYYFSRQYPSAIERLQGVLRRRPEFPSAHFNLGRAYLQSGMYREAIAAFEAAVRFSGVRQAELGLACGYARAGDAKRAHEILQGLEEFGRTHYLPSPYLAWLYLNLGDIGRALELLEQGFNEKCFLMMFLNADPVYDTIRNHPRFVNLLERMEFPQH